MGLLSTAAKVAVASSVHGRVQRRQQQRWAAQDQAAGAASPAAYAPPVTSAAPPPVAPSPTDERLAQLTQLGELRAAGVLTEDEFNSQKALILGN